MTTILIVASTGQAVALGWLYHKYSRLVIRERLRAFGRIAD